MLASPVEAADVDWKMYGFAVVGGPNVCFYDASGITRASTGYVRVWAKCLLKKDMDAVDPKTGAKIGENGARKIIG
jgi:hypothetical protein